MRLSTVLTCIGVAVALNLHAQVRRPPPPSSNRAAEERIALSRALQTLQEAYQVHFIYEDELVRKRFTRALRRITGDFYRDLQAVLGDHPIQYIKVGRRTIVLILKEEEPENRRAIIGRVTDVQGRPLEDAEVLIEGTSWGAATNIEGEYRIARVPEGKYTLVARFMGYRTVRREVEVYGEELRVENFALSPDILNMDEIVTTAARNPLTKMASSVAITTANARQISERMPTSTAELLTFIPGFYVETSGGEGGNNLFPRGIPQDGSFRYVAMLEDGMPLYEAPELAFANIDILMRVDATIASLEGVRGGTGSIFASNAPGGIINFVSKTGGNKLEGLVRVAVGDRGFYRLDYNYGGPLGRRWKFNIGGFARYDKGVRSPKFVANRGGQIKFNLTHLFRRGFVRFKTRYLNDRNIFYLPIPLQNPRDPHPIPGFDANYGTMTSVHADNMRFPTPDGREIHRRLSDGIHPEYFSATGEVAFDLGGNWSLRNILRVMKAHIDFNAIFSLDNPFPAIEFADSIYPADKLPGFARWEYRYADTHEPIRDPVGLNGNGLVARNGWWAVSKPLSSIANHFQIQKQLRRHSLSAGIYLSRYTANDFWYWHNILMEVKDAPRLLDLVALDSSGNEILAVTRHGVQQFGTFYMNARNRATLVAGSLVDEWQLSDRLRIDAGIRIEHNRFSGEVENVGEDFTVGDGTALAEQKVKFGNGTWRPYAHRFTEWAVSVGANYTFNDQLAIYGRISRGFRTPDFEQWMFSEERGFSQYVHQMESGLKMATDLFALFGAVFFSRVNHIPFVDEVVRDGRIYEEKRFAESVTLGSEMETVVTPFEGLQLSLIGTFQNPLLENMRFTTVDPATYRKMTVELSGNRVRRIPQVILHVRPSYTFKGFKIFGSWQYVGERYVDDANTAELPDFGVLNAGIIYRSLEDGITLMASVSNLTNTIGLTEGNPRVEQVFANRNDRVFMARPILGRTITISAAYTF
ncbi:MAG: TonB-dependent receptor [Calditrichaeota bacterium]|nr:MAG: TonB-dependent receptor [Calditrichota bacterium]